MRKKVYGEAYLKGFKKILLVFLIGLTIIPATLVLANDSGDIISAVENIQKEFETYVAKRDLQEEIKALDKKINDLTHENMALREDRRKLESRLDSIEGAVRSVEKMDSDPALKVITCFFLFSLAAFLSSLLCINLIWKAKVKGVRRIKK